MNRGLDWGLCLALCQKACGYLSNWALASPGPGLHSLLCGSSTNTLQHNPLCILNASVICPHANQSRLPPPFAFLAQDERPLLPPRIHRRRSHLSTLQRPPAPPHHRGDQRHLRGEVHAAGGEGSGGHRGLGGRRGGEGRSACDKYNMLPLPSCVPFPPPRSMAAQ